MFHGAFRPNEEREPEVSLRALADLNGDKRDDLVLAHGFDSGTATGRLSAVRRVTGAGALLAVHDFDLDGDSDLLAINPEGTELLWFLNTGKAIFSETVAAGPVSHVQTAAGAANRVPWKIYPFPDY